MNPGQQRIVIGPVALLVLGFALAAQSEVLTATIYVGRHFEVRDHDQPTKYVFNGATRVASVTGSISTRQRIQRLRLYPGWNLVMLAVTLADLGGNRGGNIDYVYLWNPATDDYSTVPPGQAISAGAVLWIKARAAAVIGMAGEYPDPTQRHLSPGGAFVGAGLEKWSPALSMALATWQYEPIGAGWQDHLMGSLESSPAVPLALAPGQTIFVRTSAETTLDPPDPALRIRYYHPDHLGSPSAVTDTSGMTLEESAFYPYGNCRNHLEIRGSHDPYTFAQKERDPESGFSYFEARYLSPGLGRFVTADLKYASPDAFSTDDLQSFLATPQAVGLYAYVRANPLRWTDPSGLDPGDAFKTADEAAIDALRGINPTSIKENTEYAGIVYYVPSEKLYYAGVPHKGEFQHSYWNPSEVPQGAKLVGDYHTHADYAKKLVTPTGIVHVQTSDPNKDDFNSDFFSNEDQDNQLIITGGSGRKLNFEPIPNYVKYLGTPRGHFWKIEGNSYPGSFTDLSKDSNDKFIDWVAHPPQSVRPAFMKNFYPAFNPIM